MAYKVFDIPGTIWEPPRLVAVNARLVPAPAADTCAGSLKGGKPLSARDRAGSGRTVRACARTAQSRRSPQARRAGGRSLRSAAGVRDRARPSSRSRRDGRRWARWRRCRRGGDGSGEPIVDLGLTGRVGIGHWITSRVRVEAGASLFIFVDTTPSRMAAIAVVMHRRDARQSHRWSRRGDPWRRRSR